MPEEEKIPLEQQEVFSCLLAQWRFIGSVAENVSIWVSG